MNYETAVKFLPAKVRQRLYSYLGLASLLVVSALAFFSGSPHEAPWWLESLLSALGAFMAPFGFVAASNVQETPVEQAERENRPRRDERGRFVKQGDPT